MGQVLVIGLIHGAIYGLFAVGITLVYRGTRAINFAQGEIGTLSLYAAWWLSTEHGLPWVVGAAGALVLAAAVGLAFERLVIRPMVSANPISVAVASVGLLSFLLVLELQVFGESPREVAGPIQGLGRSVAGVQVSPTQALSLVVVAAVALGLSQFLRRTDFGLGVLAAAQDPDAVRLVGVPLRRISAFVWGAGAATAALASLFIEPSIGVFAPGFASRLYLIGLVAAVVGGLSSLPGAFVGGITIGVLEAAGNRYIDVSLPGVNFIIFLAIVLAVLLWRPAGILSGLRAREAA